MKIIAPLFRLRAFNVASQGKCLTDYFKTRKVNITVMAEIAFGAVFVVFRMFLRPSCRFSPNARAEISSVFWIPVLHPGGT